MAETGRVTHWIAGKAWDGPAARSGEVYDPAVGRVTAEVDYAGDAEVDEAVAAAVDASPHWSTSSMATRRRILFAFRDVLSRDRERLAAVVSHEVGKVRADAAGEVARGLEVVDFACGVPGLLPSGFAEQVSTGMDVHSMRQPLGVVAGVTPFNFPAMLPLWMAPIAIACGNTFVLKPSEKDPSASVLLAEMWADAGLPDGVFNVVHGDGEAVRRLIEHPDVAAISFVGSTPVARAVYQAAGMHGKRVQALGGAKNHMLVLADADLDAAADAAVNAAFGSTGQRCMAVSVVVALDPIADALVERIADRARVLVVGPASDPESEMGPLITGTHRDRVASFLDGAVEQGARLVLDGRAHPHRGAGDGFWLGPSLVDEVSPEMDVYREEVFGPVLSVVRAAAYPEAVRLVNASPYGNGAAIFTRDGGAARRFATEVRAGMVGVNVPIPVPVAQFSFGGWNASLFGASHMYGEEGMRFYTKAKVVTTRWPTTRDDSDGLSFPV